MIDAGLPINHALRNLAKSNTGSKQKPRDDPSLMRCIGLVERGVGLAEAFQTSKVISEFDFAVLTSAEHAGKLADGLNHIAQRHIRQIQVIANIQASLLLPQAVLLIWAFASIFIRMLLSDDSFAQAAIPVLLVVIVIFAVTHLLFLIAQADPRLWLGYLWPSRYIRTRSQWYQALVEQLFFRSLIWQLNAGIAADQATRNNALLLRSNLYKSMTHSAADEMNDGTNIPTCLKQHGLVLSQRMRAVVSIADDSGRYTQAIEHELNLQDKKIRQKIDNIVKWTPRLYMLVAIVLISSLI